MKKCSWRILQHWFHTQWVEVVTEYSYNFFTFYLLQLYTLTISLEIKFF